MKYRVRKINPKQYVVEVFTHKRWSPCNNYGDAVSENETIYYERNDAIDCAKFFEKNEDVIVYETDSHN
jgi:hypothetical protein